MLNLNNITKKQYLILTILILFVLVFFNSVSHCAARQFSHTNQYYYSMPTTPTITLEKPQVLITTCDDNTIEIPRDLAEQSETIKNLLKNADFKTIDNKKIQNIIIPIFTHIWDYLLDLMKIKKNFIINQFKTPEENNYQLQELIKNNLLLEKSPVDIDLYHILIKAKYLKLGELIINGITEALETNLRKFTCYNENDINARTQKIGDKIYIIINKKNWHNKNLLELLNLYKNLDFIKQDSLRDLGYITQATQDQLSRLKRIYAIIINKKTKTPGDIYYLTKIKNYIDSWEI